LARTGAPLKRSKRRGQTRLSGAGADAAPGGGLIAELRVDPSSHEPFDVRRVPLVRLGNETVCGWELQPRRRLGGLESRNELLRSALEADLLVPVDLLCLAACVREARRWSGAGPLHVAVHPTTLREAPFADLSAALEAKSGAPRYCLVISEAELAGDPSVLVERRRSLREAGIELAIGDVGYGRSSLENLIVIEPDLVVLEPGFALRSARGSDQTRSLRRMLRLVAALGCELMVDGIETRADLAALSALGVTRGQGRLWGRQDALVPSRELSREGTGGRRDLRLVANG
ncbi:MAG TPA: EAL domain-containing protein, partial [Planctomycetota bacterium]|nr:EAL domain-containing protein [Planctomycetota bacterium]